MTFWTSRMGADFAEQRIVSGRPRREKRHFGALIALQIVWKYLSPLKISQFAPGFEDNHCRRGNIPKLAVHRDGTMSDAGRYLHGFQGGRAQYTCLHHGL